MAIQYPALFEYKTKGDPHHLIAMFTSKWGCVIKASKWSAHPVGDRLRNENCEHAYWKQVEGKWVDVFGIVHDNKEGV